MSLKDLADRTGEPIPTLSRWETKGGVTVEKLAKVAEGLEIAPADLITQSVSQSLTPDEITLLNRFASASPDQRKIILAVVCALVRK